jgi:hypothetical protein
MAFVARADLLGLVDLRGTIDRVTDAFPDGGEAASELGFHVLDRLEDDFVGAVEKWRDLIDLRRISA